MKAQLKLAEHRVLPGEMVVEVWYQGKFIGQVTGADGPGIRFISRHPVVSMDNLAALTQVTVDPDKLLPT